MTHIYAIMAHKRRPRPSGQSRRDCTSWGKPLALSLRSLKRLQGLSCHCEGEGRHPASSRNRAEKSPMRQGVFGYTDSKNDYAELSAGRSDEAIRPQSFHHSAVNPPYSFTGSMVSAFMAFSKAAASASSSTNSSWDAQVLCTVTSTLRSS